VAVAAAAALSVCGSFAAVMASFAADRAAKSGTLPSFNF